MNEREWTSDLLKHPLETLPSSVHTPRRLKRQRHITSLSTKELQELLHWPTMDDRLLLHTACRNRNIEYILEYEE